MHIVAGIFYSVCAAVNRMFVFISRRVVFGVWGWSRLNNRCLGFVLLFMGRWRRTVIRDGIKPPRCIYRTWSRRVHVWHLSQILAVNDVLRYTRCRTLEHRTQGVSCSDVRPCRRGRWFAASDVSEKRQKNSDRHPTSSLNDVEAKMMCRHGENFRFSSPVSLSAKGRYVPESVTHFVYHSRYYHLQTAVSTSWSVLIPNKFPPRWRRRSGGNKAAHFGASTIAHAGRKTRTEWKEKINRSHIFFLACSRWKENQGKSKNKQTEKQENNWFIYTLIT